ncbi:MAG: cation-translocating P-type ATPase [Actinomycetia bacterium]|nr:cation-translocating P-type ATPase [Actinomycetes bacterium]MCP4957942.1 cation-translocating P-type ATPase [Actinomycetes bacterium]
MTEPTPRVDHHWWAEDASSVALAFGTDSIGGLDGAQVETLRDRHGPNALEEEPTQPPIKIFLSQFANTMIVVLLAAAVIMVAIGEPTDAIVIGAIVVLNAAIGFIQEYRAEQAMAALRTMAAPNARVVRNGDEATVPAVDLVPGDVVVLEAGDIVAADARLTECPNLRVDEAALTGESVPVDKTDAVLSDGEGEVIGDRRNMVYKGTSVTYGRARAVVVATGMDTALGQIAGLLQTHRAPPTPLQKRLAVLGRWLAAAAIVICVVVFTVGVLRGEDTETMFLTSVSLAVAAIPEALPAVVTIGLALGAQRMIRHNALVRRLPAAETLGSVTVICTDKTGTLTQGRMLVEKVWTLDREYEVTGDGFEPSGEIVDLGQRDTDTGDSPFGSLLRAAVLCNDAVLVPPTTDDESWGIIGDPTEGALLALAGKAGAGREQLNGAHPRVAEIPFDSGRKWMVTIHRTAEPEVDLAAAKGAVEAIVDVASAVATTDGLVPLDDALRSSILGRADGLAAEGYRVLAIAGGTVEAGDVAQVYESELDLVLYGLTASADPPRAESGAAVAACRAAGITPVMITGDHPATGRSIGSRLGILDSEAQVMTGTELAAEHATGLADHVASIAVYARTSPEQKLDIVEAWKENGDVVAMTGDGVNDAPALRSADIGVAMGVTGTEVAKEAADMVLTDDNFASIVTAVGEGRRIYDNIRRFVRYTLTSNAGEIWVMFLGPFLGLPLPLQPVQILWINLVTDGVPGLALGVEPAEQDVMERRPRPPDENIFARGLWQHVVIVGLTMGFFTLGVGLWAEAGGRPWQTIVFTTLALLQLGHAMAVRSERQSLFTLGILSNRLLLWTVLVTLAVQVLIIYWSPMQELLKTEALSLFELAVVLVVSTGVFWVVELEKFATRVIISRRADPEAE